MAFSNEWRDEEADYLNNAKRCAFCVFQFKNLEVNCIWSRIFLLLCSLAIGEMKAPAQLQENKGKKLWLTFVSCSNQASIFLHSLHVSEKGHEMYCLILNDESCGKSFCPVMDKQGAQEHWAEGCPPRAPLHPSGATGLVGLESGIRIKTVIKILQ